MKQRNSSIHDFLETIPSFTDLKLRDAKLIADYFIRQASCTIVSREELRANSGASPLRVDAIIFAFLQNKLVTPVSYNQWGVPITYIWSASFD